jgi:23S rRNA (uracil1939-C5)-methyltransferase
MPDTLELDLTAMSYGGNAIARHEGRPIFVPFGLPGERVRARITQDKRSYAFAEVVDVIEPSPERVVPRCPHFGVCGGCHWQHIAYAAQLRFKREVVAEQLARIGGLRDVPVHPTIPSPNPWDYRSHATFHVAANGRLGFVGRDDRTVIPIDECHIIQPELRAWLDALQTERFKPGERVRLQAGTTGERVMARSKGTAVAPDDSAPDPALATAEKVHYVVKGRSFQVTGGSFFQVNQPETLVDLVLAKLALAGHERALDLYSGVGLFTAFLAERAHFVTAVEIYAPAVRDAGINLAGFRNVDLRVGVIEAALPRGEVDAAVVDPPRAGMKPKALEALAARVPGKIVYVSCDPTTLARDAKMLVARGYRLNDVQPVDLFPQTYHVESVALFMKAT